MKQFKGLCIGGPADGELYMSPCSTLEITLPDPEGILFPYHASPEEQNLFMQQPINLQHFTYAHFRVACQHFWVPADWPAQAGCAAKVMEALVVRYQKKTT